MIVDGRALAAEVLARTRRRASRLPRPPKILAYVAGDSTPATRSYLTIKKRSAALAGCVFEETADAADFTGADAVIVQLPLPPDCNRQSILDSIPAEKDADVLSSETRAAFEAGKQDALLPPVVGAIAEIFEKYGISPKGKRATVVGEGFLVGRPAALWLRRRLAAVSVAADSMNLVRHLRDADLIVSGTGVPGLIKPEMLQEGAVLIDAGTSESSGKVVGDAAPECAAKCSLFTPVPGGVGPVAVAKLFENAVTLAERASQ